VRDSLAGVIAASDFVAHACARDPQLLGELLRSGDLGRPLTRADFVARAAAAADPAGPEAQFMAQLRRWRRYEFVRIAWRDLAGWAAVPETLEELTDCADAAISGALAHARDALVARYGQPRSAAGALQPLVVIAMGKLGGRELNFSSDVDLVLLFPEHGDTDGARAIANEEFFTRLGQGLARLLGTPTADGFVLRVDLRLRPFGDSGPLVASFASFEDYLMRHGRDWERYAYVKARPVTGVERYAEVEAAAVRPFVYRRYLDYGVFEGLRTLHHKIREEAQRRAAGRPERANDVKLSRGGIRNGHHAEGPRRNDGKAKEGEDQARGRTQPHQCADIVPTETHTRSDRNTDRCQSIQQRLKSNEPGGRLARAMMFGACLNRRSNVFPTRSLI
jgi:glutamate-ammonia-ligase adenylyltransferase